MALVALVAIAFAIRRPVGRRPAPKPIEMHTPAVAAESIVALVQQENPEVGGAALSLVDERTRGEVVAACPTAAALPTPGRAMRGDVRAVIEKAMRGTR